MSSYEKLILVGNLGQDPELRFLDDATAVINLSIAVNKKRGEQRTTTWYRVSVWNGSAESASKFLKKGSKVLVEGSNLRVSQFTPKDGKPAVSLDITADRVVFLDSAEESSTPNGEETRDIPF